jgi:TatD DNase family protein
MAEADRQSAQNHRNEKARPIIPRRQKQRPGTFIDAHAHVDRYGSALDTALEEIERLRILTIAVSMDPASYRRVLGISRKNPWIIPAFGIHPWNAPAFAGSLDGLSLAVEESLLLGEIGLDHHFVKDRSLYPAQRRVLEFFLKAAADQDKIVNVHTKGAERDVGELLVRHKIKRAIIHWYSGPREVLSEYLSQGWYFTVGIEALRSEHIRSIAQEVPENRLLTETDNPGGFQWLTGKPGLPSLVGQVIDSIARARQTTAHAVAATVSANFKNLIAGDPRLAGVLSKLGRAGRSSRNKLLRSGEVGRPRP